MHSYGLDSNPSSDENENEGDGSDVEMMEVSVSAVRVLVLRRAILAKYLGQDSSGVEEDFVQRKGSKPGRVA